MEGTPKAPDVIIPTPTVEAAAQTAPTLAETTSTAVATARGSQEFLGANVAADVSRLVRADGSIIFNEITASLFLAYHQSACDARDRAETRLEAAEARNQKLGEELAAANQRAAVLQERLDGVMESAHLRNVFYSVGGALFGLIPFAAEKGSWAGGLITAVFSAICLLSARRVGSKPRK